MGEFMNTVLLLLYRAVVFIILSVFQWTAQCEWIARNDTSTNNILRMVGCVRLCAHMCACVAIMYDVV